MSEYVVITNPQLDDVRSNVHASSLPDWQLRGWILVGPSRQHGSLLTDAEQAAQDAADIAAFRSATTSSAPAAPAKKASASKAATTPRKA